MSKLLAFLFLLSTSAAYGAACDDTKLIYKVCTDQEKLFEQSSAEAKKAGKKLIVVMGADWCPWCVSLNRIFGVEEFAKEFPSYQLAEIGVYKERDRFASGDKVLERLMKAAGEKTKPKGVPILAVFNPKSGKARFVDTEPLEKNTAVSKGHDPAKLKAAIEAAGANL